MTHVRGHKHCLNVTIDDRTNPKPLKNNFLFPSENKRKMKQKRICKERSNISFVSVWNNNESKFIPPSEQPKR